MWIAALDRYGPPTRDWAHRLSSGAGRACGRSLAGGKHADGAGEAERDQHARDDAEPLLAGRRELLGRWIADPGDGGRRPSDPPPATHEPKRVPGLRIQPATREKEDDAPHAGAADAVCRVGVVLCPHR